MHSKFKRQDSGFTMIEILIVVVIAVILAAVSLPYFVQYSEGVKAADAQAAITSIYNSSKMYQQDYSEDVSSIRELEELSYLELDEKTKQQWQFTLIRRNPIFKIRAVSTSSMKQGAGKEILYDVFTGEFSGYGFPSE